MGIFLLFARILPVWAYLSPGFGAAPDWSKIAPSCNELLDYPVGTPSTFWLTIGEDPILKDRSKLVREESFGTSELKKFSENLAAEMFAHTLVSGLSAPQVRVSLRIFILRRHVMFPWSRKFDVYVNPTMIPTGDKMFSSFETCLSVRGYCWVPRYKAVRLEYFTTDGEFKREEFKGVRARMVQHEMDHLDGVLMTDK